MVNDEQAIRDLIHEMIEAFNQHDAKRSARAFTVDGDLATVRGEWYHGASEIEKGLEIVFATRAGAAQLNPIDTTVRFIGSNVALAHVKNELRGLVDAAGQPPPTGLPIIRSVDTYEGPRRG